jgi:Exopolysaccharide biosynthesis protein YbjH
VTKSWIRVIMLHSSRRLPCRTLALLALGTALQSGPALSEMKESLNINGATGLIDMPSGDTQSDARFTFSATNLGPITRATIGFQFSERLSASFRFQTWRDWDTLFPGDDDKFNDRSIDLRYQILQESEYVPALTIGLISPRPKRSATG